MTVVGEEGRAVHKNTTSYYDTYRVIIRNKTKTTLSKSKKKKTNQRLSRRTAHSDCLPSF